MNRMFLLLDQTSNEERSRQQQRMQIITEEIPRLWHERYGYLSHRGMKTLQRNGMRSSRFRYTKIHLLILPSGQAAEESHPQEEYMES